MAPSPCLAFDETYARSGSDFHPKSRPSDLASLFPTNSRRKLARRNAKPLRKAGAICAARSGELDFDSVLATK